MTNPSYPAEYKLVTQRVDGSLVAYIYAGDSEFPFISKEVATTTHAKHFFYEVLTTTDNDYDVATEVLVMVANRVEYGDE